MTTQRSNNIHRTQFHDATLQQADVKNQKKTTNEGNYQALPQNWCGSVTILAKDEARNLVEPEKAIIYSVYSRMVSGGQLSYSWIADFETMEEALKVENKLYTLFRVRLSHQSDGYVFDKLKAFEEIWPHPNAIKAIRMYFHDLSKRVQSLIKNPSIKEEYRNYLDFQIKDCESWYSLSCLHMLFKYLLIEKRPAVTKAEDMSLLNASWLMCTYDEYSLPF